ncbi:Type 1 glutamine amidotransferase-like domain-containing protein [Clostridium sp. 19966]|nr:Type 1 glutamine amidotransferase-like domain-containing protein [Clostridium sp. 19966]
MVAYLVSDPGGQYKVDGQRLPTSLNTDNGFLHNLRLHWKENSRGLIVCSSPDNPEINDSIKNIFQQSFPMSGLSVTKFDVCDNRNKEIVQKISKYDVVILSGGHVPTQNDFFHKIHLKEALKQFDGILIGISAGSMNSAEIVYAQPELEGESTNPKYQRFLPGLGITNIMLVPHYQDVKNDILDGKRVMEDITYPDSYGREFYALVDGSYVLVENGVQTLYGEGYLIKDGTVQRICEINEHICLG